MTTSNGFVTVFGRFTFLVAFGVTLIVILHLPALIPRTPDFEEFTTQINFELFATERTTLEPAVIVVPALRAILFVEMVFPFFNFVTETEGIVVVTTGAVLVTTNVVVAVAEE